MKHFLGIALFTVAVTLFYTGVAQVLPQLESHPPVQVRLGEDLSTPDLVAAGAGVFEANCLQCHKIGQEDRCPNMSGMGALAKERARMRAADTGQPFDDVDYLIESLCLPGAWLVDGYANIMPPQQRLLTPGQLLAVTAFMQDLGGTVTVSLADRAESLARLERFDCVTATGAAPAPAGAAQPVGPPEQVWAEFGCGGCHHLDQPGQMLGPSLAGLAARMDRGDLYLKLLDPDARPTPGGSPPYVPGLMRMTLEGNGFFERMTPADYRALVDWLEERTR